MQSNTIISNLISLTIYNIFFRLSSTSLFLLLLLAITNCFNCLFNCLLLIAAYLVILSLNLVCSISNLSNLTNNKVWYSTNFFSSKRSTNCCNNCFISLLTTYSNIGALLVLEGVRLISWVTFIYLSFFDKKHNLKINCLIILYPK